MKNAYANYRSFAAMPFLRIHEKPLFMRVPAPLITFVHRTTNG
jgi:hypothetical protein